VDVPARAPLTRAEWEDCTQVWPSSWRIPEGNKACIVTETVSDDLQAYFESSMLKVLAHSDIHGACNVAMIINPESGEVAATAIDETESHPLGHAVMCAIRDAAAKDLASREEEETESQRKRARVESEVVGIDTSTSAPTGGLYMCTGLDCFVVVEPCAMCAMGMVHSRINRVIYCVRDMKLGVLGGSHKLHAHRTLNHHYEVYHLGKKTSE
jgi:tRNA-specific adenosine deaminase 3